MARGRHTCRICPRRGRPPVGQCQGCGSQFCDRHGTWTTDRWLCSKCARIYVKEAVEHQWL